MCHLMEEGKQVPSGFFYKGPNLIYEVSQLLDLVTSQRSSLLRAKHWGLDVNI
jgi:hypothetical protein